MPDMGSGYGGKHTGECAVEAARLAKAAGKPVKLVWTREEEFTWAYFRPAGVMEIRSGVKRDGTLVAWEHHNYNSGPSGIGTPYKVANPVTRTTSGGTRRWHRDPIAGWRRRRTTLRARRIWMSWRSSWGWIRWSFD